MAKRTQGEGWSLTSSDSPKPTSQAVLSPEQQRIRITLEKRKKGKVVTVIGNLALSSGGLKDLAKSLKTACGTGGTQKNDAVELQGDHRTHARTWLVENGWGVQK